MKGFYLPLLAISPLLTIGAANAAPIDLGSLNNDGTPATYFGDIGFRELDSYTFSLSEDILNSNGSFLNIQTFAGTNDDFDLMDTVIALYDNNGQLLAIDDDDNGDGWYTKSYSLFSFGSGDILGNTSDSQAGQDGELNAGDYTVVVGGYHTIFSDDINNIVGGRSRGEYNIQFSFGGEVIEVSEPAGLAILGTGLLGLGSIRRRKPAAK